MPRRQVILVMFLVLLLVVLIGIGWWWYLQARRLPLGLPGSAVKAPQQFRLVIESEIPSATFSGDLADFNRDLATGPLAIPGFTAFRQGDGATFLVKVRPLTNEKQSLWYMWVNNKAMVGFLPELNGLTFTVNVYVTPDDLDNRELTANRVYWAMLRAIDKQWGQDQHWKQIDDVFRQRVQSRTVPVRMQ